MIAIYLCLIAACAAAEINFEMNHHSQMPVMRVNASFGRLGGHISTLTYANYDFGYYRYATVLTDGDGDILEDFWFVQNSPTLYWNSMMIASVIYKPGPNQTGGFIMYSIGTDHMDFVSTGTSIAYQIYPNARASWKQKIVHSFGVQLNNDARDFITLGRIEFTGVEPRVIDIPCTYGEYTSTFPIPRR